MSTRSDIIVHCADGKWARIYCHYDGYPDHNGRILCEHYASQERAEALIALGDLSVLAPECTKPEGHSFDNKVAGYCVAYGRDRRENDTAAEIGTSLIEVWPEADSWTEYTYVWSDGEWRVTTPKAGPAKLSTVYHSIS